MRQALATLVAVGFVVGGATIAFGEGPSQTNYVPLGNRNAQLDYSPPTRVPPSTPVSGGPSAPTSTPTATPVPTFTPTATPTPTPTSTPSPTPTVCAGTANILVNGGFETTGAWEVLLGSPYRTTFRAWTGNYSMYFGGRVSSTDAIIQPFVVPQWADTAAVYFYAWMASTDSTLYKYDWLRVIVSTIDLSTVLASGDVPNNSTRNSWISWRLSVPGITSFRGQPLVLSIAGVNDVSYSTAWYVDDVRMVFGCGGYPASLGGQDLFAAD